MLVAGGGLWLGSTPLWCFEGIQRALMADLSATGFFARSGLQNCRDY